MDNLLKYTSGEEMLELVQDINVYVNKTFLQNDVRGDKRILLIPEEPLPDYMTMYRHMFRCNVATLFPEFENIPFKEVGDEMMKEVVEFPAEVEPEQLSDD